MNWNSDQKALIQWITSGLKIKEVRDLKGDSGYLLNNMIAKVTLAISICLEAAHIIPYKGSSTNHVQNGILLRADINTLFDLDLLRIDKNYRINIDESIEDKEYRKFDSNYLRLPANQEFHPSKDALKKRFEYEI